MSCWGSRALGHTCTHMYTHTHVHTHTRTHTHTYIHVHTRMCALQGFFWYPGRKTTVLTLTIFIKTLSPGPSRRMERGLQCGS